MNCFFTIIYGSIWALEMSLSVVFEADTAKTSHRPLTWARIVAIPSQQKILEKKTNKLENTTGPGQQPLRNLSGFPNQQQSQARTVNPSLASARLPNGKIGAVLRLIYSTLSQSTY